MTPWIARPLALVAGLLVVKWRLLEWNAAFL
jgi:hypothetical protein